MNPSRRSKQSVQETEEADAAMSSGISPMHQTEHLAPTDRNEYASYASQLLHEQPPGGNDE